MRYFAFLLVAAVVIPSMVAFAQNNQQEPVTTLITESSGLEGGLVPCSGPECGACDLVTLADNVLQFLIYLSVFVAVVAFTWAGFLFVTAGGNEGQVTKAKGTFSAVAIGFIIVLASWLFIDTLLRLTTGEGVAQQVERICEDVEPTSGTPPPPSSGQEPDDGTEPDDEQPPQDDTDPSVVASDEYTHTETDEFLDAADITIHSSGECIDKNNPTCTSGMGLKKTTADEIVRIKAYCRKFVGDGCSTVATGLTEVGHAEGTFSHHNGYKFDLDRGGSAELDDFMENVYGAGGRREYKVTIKGAEYDAYEFTYTPERSTPFYPWVGQRDEPLRVQVIKEGSHWDVQVVPVEELQ